MKAAVALRQALTGGRGAAIKDNSAMLAQRTLKSMTRAVGVGVHGGQKVELTLRPAPADSGIVFRRVDLPRPVVIKAAALNVCDTRMATTLSADGGPDGPKVKTVEHLLSACAGLGLDNLVVDITAEEVPILDGSAASFVFLLQSAGIALQDAPKRFLRVLRTVEVREGEGAGSKWARLEPHEGYTLGFEIEFDHPVVSETGQRFVFDMGSGKYKNEIARARTFGFTKEVEMMRSRGLALGGSLDNAVVVDEFKVLNSEGLALRRRVRQAQDPRRHRRPGARRPAAAGRVSRLQVGARAQQPARPRAARGSLGLGDRHLRRRDDGAGRSRGAGARVVNRAAARGLAAASSP